MSQNIDHTDINMQHINIYVYINIYVNNLVYILHLMSLLKLAYVSKSFMIPPR